MEPYVILAIMLIITDVCFIFYFWSVQNFIAANRKDFAILKCDLETTQEELKATRNQLDNYVRYFHYVYSGANSQYVEQSIKELQELGYTKVDVTYNS